MPSHRSFVFIALFACCIVFPMDAGQTPAAFFFGGKEFSVGMSKPEALRLLSACCKLVPPVEDDVEAKPAPPGALLGHMILPRNEKSRTFLGQIFFSEGRVAKITRPLADEADMWNEDLVGFARAIKRSLALHRRGCRRDDRGSLAYIPGSHEAIDPDARSSSITLALRGRAEAHLVGRQCSRALKGATARSRFAGWSCIRYSLPKYIQTKATRLVITIAAI